MKYEEKYSGPVEKLTVAATHYLTGVLVYFAEEQGFFEKNGLEVTVKEKKTILLCKIQMSSSMQSI
jgi:hypothetical protein